MLISFVVVPYSCKVYPQIFYEFVFSFSSIYANFTDGFELNSLRNLRCIPPSFVFLKAPQAPKILLEVWWWNIYRCQKSHHFWKTSICTKHWKSGKIDQANVLLRKVPNPKKGKNQYKILCNYFFCFKELNNEIQV